jgi:hypothetical protein
MTRAKKILAKYSKENDDALVLVARYLGTDVKTPDPTVNMASVASPKFVDYFAIRFPQFSAFCAFAVLDMP